MPSQADVVVRLCSQIESSVAAIKFLALAKSAEGTAWKEQGYRSRADKLAQETQMSPGSAKRLLETGQRMSKQPEVAQAALAGELSPDQAELISHGVAANPEKAKELLEKAKELSLPELNEEVARTKAAATDLEARRNAIHAKRRLKRYTDLEGVHHAHLEGNPDNDIRLSRVIDPIRRRLIMLRNCPDQPRESIEAIEHDALINLLAVAAGHEGELSLTDLLDLGLFPQLDSSLLAGRTAAAPTRSKKLAGSPAKIIVRVDLDVLLRGVALEGELCEIKGYGPVPVSLIEDLIASGNAWLAAALTQAEEVKGISHARRRPNTAQKTALEFIYPECAVRACNVRGGLQADHREDWAKTHFTALDLLDSLCRHHHALKTHKGWALVEGRGKRDFVPPDDPRHPATRRHPAQRAGP
ncbi:MAG TPA: DUF222 domain-containing protein [Acidimicrobiales bacterium]|nr:DUF222 domain-containing protein [Acidimicrobiales bacterium]